MKECQSVSRLHKLLTLCLGQPVSTGRFYDDAHAQQAVSCTRISLSLARLLACRISRCARDKQLPYFGSLAAAAAAGVPALGSGRHHEPNAAESYSRQIQANPPQANYGNELFENRINRTCARPDNSNQI